MITISAVVGGTSIVAYEFDLESRGDRTMRKLGVLRAAQAQWDVVLLTADRGDDWAGPARADHHGLKVLTEFERGAGSGLGDPHQAVDAEVLFCAHQESSFARVSNRT